MTSCEDLKVGDRAYVETEFGFALAQAGFDMTVTEIDWSKRPAVVVLQSDKLGVQSKLFATTETVRKL